MSRVAFRFHARALAALGRDLVTNDVVAVMELVKNSYDALATTVEVRIHLPAGGTEPPYIEISDDGHGMDYATIRDVWCVIATPFRSNHPVSRSGSRVRSVTGEKGLGRLSAARLGRDLQVTTKSEHEPALEFTVNWEALLSEDDLADAGFNVSQLPDGAFDLAHGTRVRIGALSSDWDQGKIDDLRRNLARLVSPFASARDFSLHLDVGGPQGRTDLQEIKPPQFMSEPKYAIEGKVDADGAIEAEYRYRPIRGGSGRDRVIREECTPVRESAPPRDRGDLNEPARGCGPFQFEIRAWDLNKDDTRDIEKHFGERRSYVRGAIRSQRGVSVYRDHVLVLPKSDGARDWLGLDIRRVSRVGPRLSTSQVVGYVQITKRDNPRIVDTSDREGLVSNAATEAFKEQVNKIVALLEVERHTDRMEEKDIGPRQGSVCESKRRPVGRETGGHS